jgi:NADH-quinone oxidoreductase subunit F
MPASHEEKHGAAEEGINFLNGYTINEYLEEKDSLKKIELKKCISTMDSQYRFSPKFDEEKTIKIDSELVVMAIGQRADYSYLDCDIEIGSDRWISFDKNTYKTTAEDVYVAGDMGGYSKIAISAIAEAKKVAISIDKALGGQGIYVGDEIEIPEKQLDLTTWNIPKQEEKETESTYRYKNFENIKVVYTREKALREATRCMRCDRNSKQ